MEKSINKTLHSIVDYATDKFVSSFSTAKKSAGKMSSRWMTRNSNSHVVLYSGIAIAAASAVYLLVKNREALVAAMKEFMEEQNERFTTPQHAR